MKAERGYGRGERWLQTKGRGSKNRTFETGKKGLCEAGQQRDGEEMKEGSWGQKEQIVIYMYRSDSTTEHIVLHTLKQNFKKEDVKCSHRMLQSNT